MSHVLQVDGHNRPTRHRIIIIDDSKDLLELMKAVLDDEGYEVSALHTSEGAYPIIKEQKPALLILDVVMEKPDSGWQLLQILKLDAETRDIPVIMCSADVRFLTAHEARLVRLGCYILPKPFNLDDLLAMVSSALIPVNS